MTGNPDDARLYEVVALSMVSLGRHPLTLEEAESRAKDLSEGGARRYTVYEILEIGKRPKRVVSRWVRGVKCEPDHRPYVEMSRWDGGDMTNIPVVTHNETWSLNAASRLRLSMAEAPRVAVVHEDGSRTDYTSDYK